MVAGTIYLLMVLFGGGVIEAFFIDNLSKGVKEYVVDQDRQKDIRADLKNTEKAIKNFNKERKAQFKILKIMNASRATSGDEFDGFYNQLHKEHLAFQEKLIDDRLAVSKKIHANEWASIIAFSEASIDKQEEKAQKKADKKKEKELKKSENNNRGEKEPFFKTRRAITESVPDTEKQQAMISGLDEMIISSRKLDSEIRSINVKENSIIIRQDATKEELKQIAVEMNHLRRFSFDQLIEFHMLIKENTDEPEWDKIMKAFNKDLSIAIR